MGRSIVLVKSRSLREAWHTRQHGDGVPADRVNRAQCVLAFMAGGAAFAVASDALLGVLPDELMEAGRLFRDVLPYGLGVSALTLIVVAVGLRGLPRRWPVLVELMLVGTVALVGSGYYLARAANRSLDLSAPVPVDYASATAVSTRPKRLMHTFVMRYYVSLTNPRDAAEPSVDGLRVPVERTSTIATHESHREGVRALGPVRAWVGQGALGYRWLVRLEGAP